MTTLKEILVATDLEEASETALGYGRELAARFGARLHVLHVVEIVAAQFSGVDGYVPNLGELQERTEAQAGADLGRLVTSTDRTQLRAVTVLRTSMTPAAAVVDYAEEANIDLILVGTHGRRGFTRLLIGSLAERIVRSAPCPVMVVRHSEHESAAERPAAVAAVA